MYSSPEDTAPACCFRSVYALLLLCAVCCLLCEPRELALQRLAGGLRTSHHFKFTPAHESPACSCAASTNRCYTAVHTRTSVHSKRQVRPQIRSQPANGSPICCRQSDIYSQRTNKKGTLDSRLPRTRSTFRLGFRVRAWDGAGRGDVCCTECARCPADCMGEHKHASYPCFSLLDNRVEQTGCFSTLVGTPRRVHVCYLVAIHHLSLRVRRLTTITGTAAP